MITVLNLKESSNIKTAAYCNVSSTLVVQFHQGLVYSYQDVDASVALNWEKADSTGKYFHKHIRNSYEYQRINQEEKVDEQLSS